MNWSKAKTIAILFFLTLNLSLATLVYLEGRQFILDPTSQQAITQVLAGQSITLGSDFTFINHAPRRRMSVGEHPLSNRELVSLFMREPMGLSVAQTDDGERFTTSHEQISFQQGRLHYTNLGLPLRFEHETDKRSFATQIIQGLGDIGRYFALDTHTLVNGTGELAYRQLYRNHVIESNYLIFRFEQGQLTHMLFHFQPVAGFFGEARALRSTDEALLLSMRYLRGFTDSAAVITAMDLVYRVQDMVAGPYYRVFVKLENGAPHTLLVNAYTGEMIHD